MKKGFLIDNSQRILEAFKKEGVPSELIVIEGAGHGFLGDNGKKASDALVAWFDKCLTKPKTGNSDSKTESSQQPETAAAQDGTH